jgi:hypothetical protein
MKNCFSKFKEGFFQIDPLFHQNFPLKKVNYANPSISEGEFASFAQRVIKV